VEEEAGARIRLSGQRGEQRPCQRPCAGCAAGGGEARRGRGKGRRHVVAAAGAGLLGMLLPQWPLPPPLGPFVRRVAGAQRTTRKLWKWSEDIYCYSAGG